MEDSSRKIRFLYYSSVSSTNLKARELLRNKVHSWTVIVAQSQEKGYGKGENPWFSPPGGLYFSLIIPEISIKNIRLLTFIAAIAVTQSLRKKFNLEAVIKWPNDVLVPSQNTLKKSSPLGFKKIAGILVENVIGERSKNSIVGVGINTNIEKFPGSLLGKATSILRQTAKSVNDKEILDFFLKGFQELFKESEIDILNEYKKYEILRGRKVNVSFQDKKISGTVCDFDKKGALMVKLKEGRIIRILEGILELV